MEVGAKIMMIFPHHCPVVGFVEEESIVHHITTQLVMVDTPNLMTTTACHVHTLVDMESIRDHLTIAPLVTTNMVAKEEVVCQADEIIVLVLKIFPSSRARV